MNTKLHAIIWEQSRVAGILTIWLFLVTVLLFTVLSFYQYRTIEEDSYRVSHLSLLGAAILFLFRQNTVGHLQTGFERRLARLPVPTWVLALVPLGVRCIFLALYGMGLFIIYWTRYDHSMPLSILPMILTFYVIFQGLTWSRNLLIYLPLLIVSGGVLIFNVLLQVSNVASHSMVNGYLSPKCDLFLAALWLFPLLSGFLMAFFTLRDERQREKSWSLPTLCFQLPSLRRPTRKDFTSALDARVWFDINASNLRPTTVFFAGAVLGIPFAWFAYVSLDWFYDIEFKRYFYPEVLSEQIRWYPYLTIVFGAGIVGLFRDFSRTMWPISLTTFTRTKPLNAAGLAWSHLFVMTRFSFACLLVVFALIHIAYTLLVPNEITCMAESIRADGVFRPLVFYIEPLFWACVVTWMALTCLRPITFLGAALLLIYLIDANFTILEPFQELYYDGLRIFAYICCFLILMRSAWCCYHVWRDNLLSNKQCMGFLTAHVLLTLFFWWPGPLPIEVAISSYYLTLTFITLILSPLVTLPYRITYKRSSK